MTLWSSLVIAIEEQSIKEQNTGRMKLNEINTKILRFIDQIQADEKTVEILYDHGSCEQHIDSCR